MKKLLAYALVFLGSTSFSQEMIKILQSHKWNTSGFSGKNSIIYTKEPNNSKQIETTTFMPNGKLSYCDVSGESSFDANGNEVVSPTVFHCDSTYKYEIKRNMIRISQYDFRNWYFKILVNDKKIELHSIYSDEFNKN